MLCVVLAITPARTVLQLPGLARFRRMLGLFVYFYGVLHLLSYSWFDMGFDLADISRDITKRPFILVGFTSFALLSARRHVVQPGDKGAGCATRAQLSQAGLQCCAVGDPSPIS